MATEQSINPVSVRAKIQWHLEEAKKLQDALDVIMSAFSVTSNGANNTIRRIDKPNDTTKKIEFAQFKIVTPITFKSVITGILEKLQKPLTAKELMALYESSTNKKVKYSNFSGQFSGLSTRDRAVKKIVINENPIETRYYYGLPEWFDADNLKEVYTEKIKAGQIQLY